MRHNKVYYAPRTISNYEEWEIGDVIQIRMWPGFHSPNPTVKPWVSPLRYPGWTIATSKQIYKLIKVILTTERAK